ncbi:uncharacterized protein LOC134708393 [Mytilus trossulus]|uniref:uncharacterized protein LOC134708393 n=1 Tax=Mytilus trossulus TaxID=6551 RepID=UPI00300692A3
MNHKIVISVVGFVLAIVAAVFDFIGFVAPYWSWINKSVSISGRVIHLEHNEGLWRYCLTIVNVTSCGSQGDRDLGSWFTEVQVVETLGLLCLLAAVIVLFVGFFVCKDVLKWVGIGCLTAAEIFIVIGVRMYKQNGSSLRTDNTAFAFYFVIVASVFAFAASTCLGGYTYMKYRCG